MSTHRLNNDTLKDNDIVLLYHLSSSIRHSTEPNEICQMFLQKIKTELHLEQAEIWINQVCLRPFPEENKIFVCFEADSETQEQKQLTAQSTFLEKIDSQNFSFFTKKQFKSYFPKYSAQKGHSIVIQLQDIGFAIFQNQSAPDESMWQALVEVFEQLTSSFKNSFIL